MERNKQLVDIKSLLEEGRLGGALNALQNYLLAYPQPHEMDQLESIRSDFQLMVDYWRKGFKDPQQEELYHQLLRRAYTLDTNLLLRSFLHSSPYLLSLHTSVRQNGRNWSVAAIRMELEDFVTNVAMLELEPHQLRQEKTKELYVKHQRSMNDLFVYILTSRMWSEGIGDAFRDILLMPTVDEIDQQLMVTAVMLSCMNHFDMVKFRLLTEIYQQAEDEKVRQRALIGWVCSLNEEAAAVFPEERELVRELVSDERCVEELIALQLQMILCMEAESDTRKIRDEILPEIMKNTPYHITPNGIQENEEDSLEEVLHPEVSERRMEQLEASMQKMTDMQKSGSDIYFGGFARMKNFDFFKDISNWFVPFYRRHPQLTQWDDNRRISKAIDNLVDHLPFCNSDKYSFVCGFGAAEKMLNEDMLNVLSNGEVNGVIADDLPSDSAVYIRKFYLQDMYRFFKVFPHRSLFVSPFDTTLKGARFVPFLSSRLFEGTQVAAHLVELAVTLSKHHMDGETVCVLNRVPEEHQDERYFLLRGSLMRRAPQLFEMNGEQESWLRQVLTCYQAALAKNPTSREARNRIARTLFELQEYEQAKTMYEQLSEEQPDNRRYQLYKAICLINLEHYEEALPLLYELHYHDEDDEVIVGVLAKALTEQESYEQAEKYYKRLMEQEKVSDQHLLDYAYLLWYEGKTDLAIAQLKRYQEQSETSVGTQLESDRKTLLRHGISETEIQMMTALFS